MLYSREQDSYISPITYISSFLLIQKHYAPIRIITELRDYAQSTLTHTQ